MLVMTFSTDAFPRVPEVEDLAADRLEDRELGLVGRPVPSHEHGDRTGGSTVDTARHGGLEARHAARRRDRGDGFDRSPVVRAHLDPRAPASHHGQGAVRTEHDRVDRRRGRQAGDQRVDP
jgi:hypothetical protein